MKKMIFLSVFSLFLFSSFTTTNHNAAMDPFKKMAQKSGVAWHIKKTEPIYDFLFRLCNGDWVSFPEGGTIYWDLHGVENGKISLIQGKAQISGTGINESTGEVFTIVNDRSKEVEIDIAVSGLSVFTGHGEVTLVGSNGTVYHATSFIHYTINPKGETTVEKMEITEDCQ